MRIKFKNHGNGEGAVRLNGKWWTRQIHQKGEITWFNKAQKVYLSGSYGTYVAHDRNNPLKTVEKLDVTMGSQKLFERLEKLWAARKESPARPAGGQAIQRFPRLAEPESKETSETKKKLDKASASAAIFESTDPRYCVKLFATLSKKYPGQASIHIYQNPQRQHKFYTLPIKTAIRETEKFLALLRQMSQEEK